MRYMFPLKILLRRKISLNSTGIGRCSEILPFFEKEFIKLKADNVHTKQEELIYANRLFKIKDNLNIMYAVDKGKLHYIVKDETNIEIQYRFSLLRTIFLCFIAAVVVLILFNSFNHALISFCWLAGMNWFITVFRQSLMLKNLSIRLEKELNSKA